MEADREAYEVVEGPAHERVLVHGIGSRVDDGWEIELRRAEGEVGGDPRFRKAIRRLCTLDGAVGRAVRNGRTRNCFVPLLPQDSGGLYRATDLVTPLLLRMRFEEPLYKFQRDGVAWLLQHERAILGDDMGLGKTAQALAATRRLIRFGQIEWALAVVPGTLIDNWKYESKKWSPELAVATALPPSRSREQDWKRLIGRAHLIVTSYEQLREPPAALLENPPGLLVADEAHRLRRGESQAHQGLRNIRARRFWALTGTPVERDAEDLAVLMSLLEPSRFSPADKRLHPTALRARVRPYLLRRHKTEVLDELPDVIEENEILVLNPKQVLAYQKAIRNYTRQPSFNFLSLFNELRAICDVDPSTGESSKLDRVVEVLDDIASAGEKAVVFSYVLEPLRTLAKRLSRNGVEIGYVTLTGEIFLEERNAVIQRFKTDQACTALLASTRVASEGLTLTEANHVIFINRWWNPSANAQARDRVVRIGQERTVRVKSFVCQDTVEDRLEAMLDSKKLTFNQLVEALATTTQKDIEDSLID